MSDDRTYRDAVVRITELVSPTDATLDEFTFINCVINGPAVIAFAGSEVTEATWDGPGADAVLWEIQPHRQTVLGAILAKNCIFEGCRFHNIGVAGPRQTLDDFRTAMRG